MKKMDELESRKQQMDTEHSIFSASVFEQKS